MKKQNLILLVLVLFVQTLTVGQKNITVEDIWQDYKFTTNSVPGFNFQNDGKHYTRLEGNKIVQYDLTSGESTATIFDAVEVTKNKDFNGDVDAYTFSEDENKIIIKTETESIYRHSTRANFYIWDRKSKNLSTVSNESKQRYVTFSPQADKVAYVRGNDIYFKDLKTQRETRISQDGKINEIINGATDWVYEEEFSFARAFEWSADGNKIAFMRFDEKRVKEFTMMMYNDDVYPEYVTFKYPKVGEENAIVSIHIFNTKTGKTVEAISGKDADIYFPRIKWTQDPNKLCITKLNRHQNELELLLADATTGKTSTLLNEKNKYYIDITDNLTFLKDGKSFIWTSEESGFNHIYLYTINEKNQASKKGTQITSGHFDVTEFYGVDEKNGAIYYQAAEESPLERQVYRVSLNGKRKQNLTPKKGWNNAQFSSTFDYYVNSYSTINTPNTFTVFNKKNKEVRVIEKNESIRKIQKEYGWIPTEFLSIKNSNGDELNAWMIKPPNFDETKKYPVFMYLYGGPGSQTVKDKWGGFNPWWFQMLAQKGYIVVSVDNRGTGARGEAFKKMTHLELGKYETIDQIDAAKHLASLPYTDANRIGIFGWSYGGYMSSLCLFKGNDVFKTAIAVAPVTNWKWYDSVYTERYMQTEKENAAGFRNNSPVYFADQLKGNYLLVHGSADDNVHFQNTMEMANALINANKQFDTYFYPNKNHGIYGGNTRLHLYTKMTNFLLEKL